MYMDHALSTMLARACGAPKTRTASKQMHKILLSWKESKARLLVQQACATSSQNACSFTMEFALASSSDGVQEPDKGRGSSPRARDLGASLPWEALALPNEE